MSRVEINRAYKFRLYPTSAQVAELSEWERQLRRLFNLGHEQRLASLDRLLRPKSPGANKVECMSCGAPVVESVGIDGKIKKTVKHAVDCPTLECRSCGAVRDVEGKTAHTVACAFVDYYRQGREMTALLADDDQLARVVCSARQEVLRDVEKAWQRWRNGLGGKPRFKRRTDSCRIYFSNPKAWKVEIGSLSFSGAASSVGARMR